MREGVFIMKKEGQKIFKEKLDELFKETTKSSMIHECTMHVENGDGGFIWNKGYY